MKKLLSLILTLCMFGAFAISASADAGATKLTQKINVTETKTGVTVEYSVSGNYANFNAMKGILSIDDSKVTYDYADATFESIQGWTSKKIGATSKYIVFSFGEGNGNTADYITGNNQKLVTFKFTKVAGTTLAKGDIKIAATQKIGRVTHKAEIYCGGVAVADMGIDNESFKAYVDDTPVAPVVDAKPADSEGGIVGTISAAANTADSTKFDWTLPVVAPIGKTVKVTDGTNNFFVGKDGKVAGTSASGAKLTVTFEDNTASVITYVLPIADIYGDANGIAAFGKGTIAADDEYGIIFTGLDLTHSAHKDGKFPAKWNADGIFAVEINNAPKGDYSAQAYIGDATGAVLEFSK